MCSIARKVLFSICLIIFIFSGIGLIYMKYQSYNNKSLNKNVLNKISQVVEEQTRDINENDTNIMEMLLDINSDIKGVIKIDNTKINYPVVQCENNEFYINHDIKKEKSKYGTIFIDYRNELEPNRLQGQNIILYGHNMKDESMFSDLKVFRNKEFNYDNSIIYLDMFYKRYRFEIFSVFLVNEDFNYRKTYFENDQELNYYLKGIEDSSLYFKDIELNCKDTILTLSTCEYDWENARLVVQGKLIEEY